MNRKLLKLLTISILSIGLTGCGNKYKGKGTAPLEEHGNLLFEVERENKDCVNIKLALYDDGQYELFTDYATCRPFRSCTRALRYTKSVKGTYEYDTLKIIEASTNANDKAYSMDDLPEYRLYVGEEYSKKYDTLSFTVEKGQTNRYLDELLEQLDIDLDACANPDYVK